MDIETVPAMGMATNMDMALEPGQGLGQDTGLDSGPAMDLKTGYSPVITRCSNDMINDLKEISEYQEASGFGTRYASGYGDGYSDGYGSANGTGSGYNFEAIHFYNTEFEYIDTYE